MPLPRPPSSKTRSFESAPQVGKKQGAGPESQLRMGLHPSLKRGAPKWQSGRAGPSRPCRLVSSRGTPLPSPLPDGVPDAAELLSGCPSLGEPPGASGSLGSGRLADPAPRSPFRFRSALGTTPPGPSLSGPGSRLSARGPAARARYSPPTRYMLAAMAVPAAASGRTKGPGGSGEVRPEAKARRGAGAARKSRSGTRSRHRRRLSRRSSSPPAAQRRRRRRSPRTPRPGPPLGFFRNELGRSGSEPARALPSRSRSGRWARGLGFASSPSAFGRRENKAGARLGSEIETPALGHFRKPLGCLRPPRPALGYFRRGSAPPPGAGEERA